MFHVNYQTIYKWVSLYRTQGEGRLFATYARPGKRIGEELEEKITLLKEKNPAWTLRKTKKILERDGIRISIKGIWGIWKRYGYAGFDKDGLSSDFTDYITWSKEARRKFEQAKEVYASCGVKESARILNSIPALPPNEFIEKIPDSFLNIRRQVEKIHMLWGKIPLPLYQKRVGRLFEKCIRLNLFHLALRVGMIEIGALRFTKEPSEVLTKLRELKMMMGKQGDHYASLLYGFWFSILCREGYSYTSLLNLSKVRAITRMCRNSLKSRKNIAPFFTFSLGALYDHMQDHKAAEIWYLKALKRMDEVKSVQEVNKKEIRYHLARIYFIKGEYSKAFRFLKDAKLNTWGFWGIPSAGLLHKAMWLLINGKRHKAVSITTNVISQLQKEEVNKNIDEAYLLLACSHCSLGDHVKAGIILKRLLPFLVKTRRRRLEHCVRLILSKNSGTTYHIAQEKMLPTIKLVLFLRNGKYQKALNYAKQKAIVYFFHRYIFFFPELVTRLIERGRPTGLPRTMLRLPVFNREIPVYNVRFLGDVVIQKNQRNLKAKLRPKDTAFLIHFASKAGEVCKKIPLTELYVNFWRNSANPSRNLSHLLVRVKKALNIPAHLLEIVSRKGDHVLINRGIQFVTDYQEFEQVIAGANAFQRAERWEFAKKEYLRAFRLFRSEPFVKMYDDWSETMRGAMLNRLEHEIDHFVKSCMEHKNTTDVKKLLERMAAIIPNNQSILTSFRNSG